jgi:hypothetical protein
VVDLPAYESTSVYARSLEAMELDLKTMELEEQKSKTEMMKRKIRIKTKL